MAQLVKKSTCNAGDLDLIPGLRRYPGEGKGYPLQYSGLEYSMDYIAYGVAKGRTWLSDFHLTSLLSRASQFDLMVNNLPASTRDARDMSLIPELGRRPWRRSWQPNPVFLPGESRGQRNLAGYSPWVHKSRTQLSHLAHTHTVLLEILLYFFQKS